MYTYKLIIISRTAVTTPRYFWLYITIQRYRCIQLVGTDMSKKKLICGLVSIGSSSSVGIVSVPEGPFIGCYRVFVFVVIVRIGSIAINAAPHTDVTGVARSGNNSRRSRGHAAQAKLRRWGRFVWLAMESFEGR